MPDLTREELIEQVAEALADDWNPHRDPVLTAMFRDYAATAADAVLRLIADDLDRKADSDHDMNCSCEKCIEQTGVLIAAALIRSLLPSTEGDQP